MLFSRRLRLWNFRPRKFVVTNKLKQRTVGTCNAVNAFQLLVLLLSCSISSPNAVQCFHHLWPSCLMSLLRYTQLVSMPSCPPPPKFTQHGDNTPVLWMATFPPALSSAAHGYVPVQCMCVVTTHKASTLCIFLQPEAGTRSTTKWKRIVTVVFLQWSTFHAPSNHESKVHVPSIGKIFVVRKFSWSLKTTTIEHTKYFQHT